MGKGLNLATAILAGAVSISAPAGAKPINEHPTEEVSGCAELAYNRVMQVCGPLSCGEYLTRQVESKIFTDCEKGAIMPEPGSVLDQCDLESLEGTTKSYLRAGHLTESFNERRDAGYVRCLENRGLTKQDKAPAEVKRQPKEVLGSMSDLSRCKEQVGTIISQICFAGNPENIKEILTIACLQGKQKIFKLMKDILREQNTCE